MTTTTTQCPHHAKMMLENKTLTHNSGHHQHMIDSASSHNLHDGMIVSFNFSLKFQ